MKSAPPAQSSSSARLSQDEGRHAVRCSRERLGHKHFGSLVAHRRGDHPAHLGPFLRGCVHCRLLVRHQPRHVSSCETHARWRAGVLHRCIIASSYKWHLSSAAKAAPLYRIGAPLTHQANPPAVSSCIHPERMRNSPPQLILSPGLVSTYSP